MEWGECILPKRETGSSVYTTGRVKQVDVMVCTQGPAPARLGVLPSYFALAVSSST